VLAVVVQSVVRLGLPRAGLSEDLAAEALGEERLYVRLVLRHDEVEQVRGLSVIRDQVRRPVAGSQVEHLNPHVTLTGRHLTRTLGQLLGVVRGRNKNAHGTVEDLIDPVEDQISIVRLHD
jgi:hypothetical protein